MEFLDPQKHKAHLIRLAIGYFLVGTALILTTIILLYQANGFGYRNGEVIQNGLIFVSSRPDEADIFINGQQHEKITNARLLMPGGQYTFELKRDGYRSWKRAINLEGGTVVRFDYPVLFPAKLTTTEVKKYSVQPPLTTQSPDRNWLFVQSPSAYTTFELFDLRSPEKAVQAVVLPENLFEHHQGVHRWKTVEWSNDNRHVVLQHSTEQNGALASEYILLDRENPDESVNLSQLLSLKADDRVELRDKKYDKYYVFNKQDKTLKTASLEERTPKAFLENILDFKSHGDDVLLYATDQATAEDKATIKLREGDRSYIVRQIARGDTYLLDLARYENAWYVAAGAPAEGRTYLYKNPVAALREQPKSPLVPVQVLKTANAQSVTFSDNARFIVAQGGQQFAVYDAENDRGYSYAIDAPIDIPQTQATWMDGHRLMAVSNGKVVVFDFDNANSEVLVNASPAFTPYFDSNFEFLYTMNAQTSKDDSGTESTHYYLNSTALLAPADQ